MKNSKPVTADIAENLERNRISHHIVLAYLRAAAILLKAYMEIKAMEHEPPQVEP